MIATWHSPPPSLGATLDTWGLAGCTFPLLPGGSMNAAFLLFLPALPFSLPLPHPQECVCPSLCCPALVKLSPCCVFALLLVLLCAVALLPARASLPPFPSFVLPAFVCVLPLPVLCPCGFPLVNPLLCCGWLSLFPSSFPPQLMRVCENVWPSSLQISQIQDLLATSCQTKQL